MDVNRIISNFCGYSVCTNDAKRTRPDPKNPDSNEYYRICEICNSKYINRAIQDEFMEEFNVVMEKLKIVEAGMQKEQKKCKQNQNILDDLNNQVIFFFYS